MSSEAINTPHKSNALIDIVIVVAASAAAFFLETALNTMGAVNMSDSSRGASAVLGGAFATLAIVKYRGGSVRGLGFKRPERWITVPFWVAGILTAFVIGQTAVPAIIAQFMTLPTPDMSKYDHMTGDLPASIAFALLLVVTASIPEEIIYRGFLIGRLEVIFGTSFQGTATAVIVQSLIFGSVHYQWGIGGMLMTVIMGLIWGTSYLLCGRNLWIVIMAHSGGHVLLATTVYLGSWAT